MHISREGIQVTARFFEAIDMLKLQGAIRGLQTFTREYCINRWNMITVKQNPETSVLKPEWIVFLCRDFNVSADWLLLGKGGMFGKSSYNFNIDVSQIKVSISEIEQCIGKMCKVKYMPSKNTFTTVGKIRKIRYSSRKNAPVIEIETENKTNNVVNIYAILSIEPVQ
jgi:hypothetical protein